MEVVFADARLEMLCRSPQGLDDRFGAQAATRARARLASLRAASSLEEFRHLPGRCREAGDQKFMLDVLGNVLLTLEPIPPPAWNGPLDWKDVRSVRVLSLTTIRRSHG